MKNKQGQEQTHHQNQLGKMMATVQLSKSKSYFRKLVSAQNEGQSKIQETFEPKGLKKCGRCSCCDYAESKQRKLKQKMGQIQKAVTNLNQKTQGISEETGLMSANFSYILELVSENIKREFGKQLPLILLEKDNSLQTLHSDIEKLSLTLSSAETEIKQLLKFKERVDALEAEVDHLKSENRQLKAELEDRSIDRCESILQSASQKLLGVSQKNETATDSSKGNCRVFRVKKRLTQYDERESSGRSIQLEKEQFGSLKSRIAKLKAKLQVSE